MINKLKAALATVLRFRDPIKVAHYVTYRCNLACDMCGRRAIPSHHELPTGECIELQREFRKHGTVVWSYSGGECLLRDDIIDLAESAKTIGLKLIIVTNGILLPDKLEIAEYADVINVSVDGNKGTHDKLRGAGNFDKTLAALAALKTVKRKGLKKVINTIISRDTIQHLDFMLDLAGDYDCELGFNPVIVHRTDLREINAKKYFPSGEQFRTFVNWLEAKKRGPGRRILFDEPSFFAALGDYPANPSRIPCYAGIFQCSLDPRGKVLPCSDYFDFPEQYEKHHVDFGYGYQGFKALPRHFPCQYQFCCTAKKNFFFSRPWLILKHFSLR